MISAQQSTMRNIKKKSQNKKSQSQNLTQFSNEDHGNSVEKPGPSKILLTPWSDKNELMANKQYNRISQISQMSQNGLKLLNGQSQIVS